MSGLGDLAAALEVAAARREELRRVDGDDDAVDQLDVLLAAVQVFVADADEYARRWHELTGRDTY